MVVRQGRFLGFRSELCGGKMLQARHRARGRLCFYNLNHGINEQWETHDELPGEDWRSCAVRLKTEGSRRASSPVEVMRVPADMTGAATPSAARPIPRIPRAEADDSDHVGDAETGTETRARQLTTPTTPANLEPRRKAPAPPETAAKISRWREWWRSTSGRSNAAPRRGPCLPAPRLGSRRHLPDRR